MSQTCITCNKKFGSKDIEFEKQNSIQCYDCYSKEMHEEFNRKESKISITAWLTLLFIVAAIAYTIAIFISDAVKSTAFVLGG